MNIRCKGQKPASNTDQKTPPPPLLCMHTKLQSKSQNAQTVMEEVDSTPRHVGVHSSCLAAQRGNSSPARCKETGSAPAPQQWINHTNFTRTNPYFTSNTRPPLLSCSGASVRILICVMKYLIPPRSGGTRRKLAVCFSTRGGRGLL